MADLIIPDNLAQELQTLAEQEKRSVPELLESMLDQYQAVSPREADLESDPLLKMAELAKAANLTFTDNNVASRSREILETEYADYLLKRMRGEDADT